MACKLYYNGMYFDTKAELASYLKTLNIIVSSVGDVENLFDISSPRMASVVQHFNSPRVYNEAKYLLVQKIDEFMNPEGAIIQTKTGRLRNVPLTRAEAIGEAYKDLALYAEDLQDKLDGYEEEHKAEVAERLAAGEELSKRKQEFKPERALGEDFVTYAALKCMIPLTVFNGLVHNIYPSIEFNAKKGTYIDGNLEFKYKKDTGDDYSDNLKEDDDDVGGKSTQFMGTHGSQYRDEQDSTHLLRKVSVAVKEFMSTVFTHEGAVHVNPSKVFAIMLNTMTGIKSSNETDQIKRNFEDPKIGMQERDDNAEFAIYNKIMKIHAEASRTTYPDGRELPIDDYKFVWVAGIGDNQRGNYEFHNYINKTITRLPATLTTESKFKLVQQESGLDFETIRLLYLKPESGERLNSIFLSINSLRDMYPAFCKYDTKFITGEDKKTRLFQEIRVDFYQNEVRLGPIKTQLKNTITRNFEALLKQKKSLERLQGLKSASNPDTLKKFNQLMISANIFTVPLTTDHATTDKLILDALGIVTRLEKVNTPKEVTPEGIQLYYTPQDVMKNSKSSLNVFAEAMYAHYQGDQRASSYTGGDGKQRWFFRNSSTGMETLRSFVKKTSKPKFTINPFFKLNAFVDKTNEIYVVTNHDSIANSEKTSRSAQPVVYSNEDETYWRGRNFLYNFCAFISGHTREGLNYLQQFYAISNKPDVPQARINVMDHTQLKDLIVKAIKQEASRPKTPLVEALKTFQRDKSFLPTKLPVSELIKNPEIHAETILKNLYQMSLEALNSYLDLNPQLNNSITTAYAKLRENEVLPPVKEKKLKPGEKAEKKPFELKDSPLYYAKGKLTTEEQRKDLIEYLHPLYDLYFKNYYMNSFFLNQLVAGDQAQYPNSEDQIKRMSIAFAQGLVGRVNDQTALRKTFNIMVLEDVKAIVALTSDLGQKFKRIADQSYKWTDAQGYATPERMDNVRLMSREANIGVAAKPAYAGIDEAGVMRDVKYSTIELTNELCKTFPDLAELRRRMVFGEKGTHQRGEELLEKIIDGTIEDSEQLEYNTIIKELYKNPVIKNRPVDEVCFASAFKVGAPAKLTKVIDGVIDKVEDDSVIVLANENHRHQLNPRHDSDSFITHFTQLTYQIDTNGKNPEELATVLNTLASINRIGLGIAKKRLSTPTKRKNVVRSILDKVEGNERYVEFLDSDVDVMNLPFLSNKFAQALIGAVSKDTVEVKHKGTKLTLQSAWGTNRALEGQEEPKLIFTDKNGEEVSFDKMESYRMECYIPLATYNSLIKQYRDRTGATKAEAEEYILNNDIFSDIMGYRIPSTELHSAVPIRVKGWYPTKYGDNIVIAPKELVLLHGSDFDIDALYIVTPYTYEGKKDKNFLESPDGYIVARKGMPIGYDTDGTGKIVPITSFLQKGQTFVDWIESELKIYDGKKGYEEYVRELEDIVKKAASNVIVDTFNKTIRAEKNMQDMIAPITMAEFNDYTNPNSIFRYFARLGAPENNPEPVQEKDESKKDFNDRMEKWVRSVLYIDRDLNREDHEALVHRDNFSGSALTGAFANGFKIISYIFMATRNFKAAKSLLDETQELPLLKPGYHMDFDNVYYDRFNRFVKTIDAEGNEVNLDGEEGRERITIWQGIDSLINAAIDNVKEQILSVINATDKTNNAIAAMVAYGIPMKKVSLFMKQPAIMDISKRSRDKEAWLTVRQELIGQLNDRYSKDPRTIEGYEGPIILTEHDQRVIDKAQKAIDYANEHYTDEGRNQEKLDRLIKTNEDIIARIKGEKTTKTEELVKILLKADIPINSPAMEEAFDGDYTKFTADQLLFQLSVLNKFRDFNTIGSNFLTTGAIGLGILQQLPGSFVKMQIALDNLSNFFDLNTKEVAENTPFENVNLLAVPNIESALDVVTSTMDLVGETTLKDHKNFVEFSRKMKLTVTDVTVSDENPDNEDENEANSTEIGEQSPDKSLESLGNRRFTDYNVFKDMSNIRDAMIEYVISGTEITDPENAIVYDFTTANEPPLAIRAGKGDKEHAEEVFGTAAWTSRFINEGLDSVAMPGYKMMSLYDIKEEYGDKGTNEFLRYLEIKDNGDGPYLSFQASNKVIDESERMAIQQAFLELANLPIYLDEDGKVNKKIKPKKTGTFNELQYMILKYEVLEKGLSFASNNYSNYMAPEIYSGVAQHLNEKLKDFFVDNNEDALEKLHDHFLLQMVLQNVESLPTLKVVKDAKKKVVWDFLLVGENPDFKYTTLDNLKEGLDEEQTKALVKAWNDNEDAIEDAEVDIIYDAVIEDVNTPPVFGKVGTTAYVRTTVRKSPTGKKYAYYQKIERQTGNRNYQWDEDVLNKGYKIKDFFKAGKLYLPITFAEGNTFITNDPKAEFLLKGDLFEAYDGSDYSRRSATTRVVTKIEKVTIDNREKYKITTRSAKESELEEQAKTIEQNQQADIGDESQNECKGQ